MHKNKSGKKEIRLRSNALVPAIMHACVGELILVTVLYFLDLESGSSKYHQISRSVKRLQPSIYDLPQNHANYKVLDSRRSGMKIYKPLVVGKFLGTYVNWSHDYIMFKKTRSGKSIEDIFMTHEGRLPAEIEHSDLVLNLERLAIHAHHINDFIRVRSDPDGKIDANSPGLCLVYPSLKKVAIVELWPKFEKQTQNLSIRPKTRFGTVLPSMFCPYSPSEFAGNGKVRIVQNRWHQKVQWMRLIPGRHRPLVPANRGKSVVIPKQPAEPKKLPGISRYTLVNLRALCQKRGIDEGGSRQLLIERIQNDEKARYPRAMIQYKKDLRDWAGVMLGHTNGDWEKDVLVARADAINKVRLSIIVSPLFCLLHVALPSLTY